MPSRPALTILLLTGTQVLRADFSSGAAPRQLGLWRGDRPPGFTPETAAELALALGPKPARKVLVLTTHAWTQRDVLAAQSSRRMNAEELSQALAFEVESYSDMGAFDSRAAHVELPSSNDQERAFWVTQISSGDLGAIEEVVKRRGAKLVGVAHPAGVPASLHGGAAWQRLEFWGETICCVGNFGGRLLAIASSDARSDRWQSTLAGECEIQSTTERLIAPQTAVPAQHKGDAPLALDDDAAAELWFTAWAAQVSRSGGNSQVPLLHPVRRPLTARDRMARSAVGAAVVLLLCGLHWAYGQYSLVSMGAEQEKFAAAGAEKKGYTTRLTQVKKEQEETQKAVKELREERRQMAALGPWRSRHLELLRFLAESANENLVIQEIAPSEGGLSLRGLAVTTDSAMWLASDLRDPAFLSGWLVRPPLQEGKNQLDSGGPWTFSINLSDVPPPDPETDLAEQREVAATPRGSEEIRNTRGRVNDFIPTAMRGRTVE